MVSRASLLPAGITGVEGSFDAGDPVDLSDPDGHVVARGLVNYDAAEIPALMGRSTRWLAARKGPGYEREVVHRDDLVKHQGRAFRDVVTPTEKLPAGVPIFRSPEWQANAWAAAFLMPLPAVRTYLQGLSEKGREFTSEGFASHFQVSRQAAAIRLEKLLPALVSSSSGE